jgi:RHS repeat-associated protein
VTGLTAQGPTFTVTSETQLTDSLGNVSLYTASVFGGKQYVLSASGPGCSSCTLRTSVQTTFDNRGNVLSRSDALGRTTSYTYDSNDNVLSESVSAGGSTTATTSYTYNSFAEVLTVTDPLGNTTTNAYDGNGNLLSVTTPAPDGNTAASVTHFAYDSKGELTQITDPLNHVTNLTYTPAGLIQSITDAQNNLTTYGYDVRGNRTSVIDPINGSAHPTTFAYDIMNRLTSITYPDNTSVSFGYDYRGRRTSATDQNNRTTTYAYDDADRLTTVTDAAGHVTQYAYDTENNLLSITDANSHTTSFAYDAYGRVTQTTFPSALTESYGYDAIGNLTSKTDRKGQTIQYVYDALNRLVHKGYPDSSGADYVYDLVGKIRQVADPTGTYGFAYDNMGRLIGTTTQYSFLPGPTFTNSYSYDAGSNRTGFTAPDGSTATYGYDTLNRLNTLSSSFAGQFNFGYDALSRRTSLTRPNGVNTAYNYDSLSRLLSVLHQVGSTTVDGAVYTVDAAGNRTAKQNLLNGITESYTYDLIYQLTQAAQGGNVTESYSYDAVGNRLTSLTVPSLSYNSSNELVSTFRSSYTYDYNGNLTSKANSSGTTGFTWDYENRLTSVTLPNGGGTVTFKYDPFGRRIQKSGPAGTSNYLYDGANVVTDLDANGAVLARYAQGAGIDEPLASSTGLGTAFFEADGLGSVTSLSGATGITDTYTYKPFGITTATGSNPNRFRFTGREWDSETNLYYYRARYYDPSTGRFISEDPARSTSNFYPYTRNNPVNRTDPLGLWDTYTHHALIWNALKGCGVSNEDIWQIQEESDFADLIWQLPGDAYKHSMKAPWQSSADAIQQSDSWVQDNLNSAASMYQTYGDTASVSNPTSTWTTPFGDALHTIMDSTSPMHRQKGQPLNWPGSTTLHHGSSSTPPGSWFGSGETWENMTPGLMQQNIQNIRNAYEQVTGHKCGCQQ